MKLIPIFMTIDTTFYTAAGPRVRLVDAETFEQLKREGYLINRSFVLQSICKQDSEGEYPICSFYMIDVDGPSVVASHMQTPEARPAVVAPRPAAPAHVEDWECIGSVPVYYYFCNQAYPIGEQEDYTLYEKNGKYQIRNGMGKTFYVQEAKGHRSSFQYYFYDHGERYFNI